MHPELSYSRGFSVWLIYTFFNWFPGIKPARWIYNWFEITKRWNKSFMAENTPWELISVTQMVSVLFLLLNYYFIKGHFICETNVSQIIPNALCYSAIKTVRNLGPIYYSLKFYNRKKHQWINRGISGICAKFVKLKRNGL